MSPYTVLWDAVLVSHFSSLPSSFQFPGARKLPETLHAFPETSCFWGINHMLLEPQFCWLQRMVWGSCPTTTAIALLLTPRLPWHCPEVREGPLLFKPQDPSHSLALNWELCLSTSVTYLWVSGPLSQAGSIGDKSQAPCWFSGTLSSGASRQSSASCCCVPLDARPEYSCVTLEDASWLYALHQLAHVALSSSGKLGRWDETQLVKQLSPNHRVVSGGVEKI